MNFYSIPFQNKAEYLIQLEVSSVRYIKMGISIHQIPVASCFPNPTISKSVISEFFDPLHVPVLCPPSSSFRQTRTILHVEDNIKLF